jgi:hypothetical protein
MKYNMKQWLFRKNIWLYYITNKKL